MSNYEWGMFLVVVICIVAQILTILEADKRIKEEKNHSTLVEHFNQRQKVIIADLEKENEELQEIAKTYEQLLLEAEEAAQDVIESYKKHLKLETCTISELATELCKREDVKHFLIDVKNDTQNYSLSGGH